MTRHRWSASLIVVVVVLLTLAIVAMTMADVTRARHPSSLAPQPEGLLAFRRLLAAMDVETATLDRPWSALHRRGAEAFPGVLIVATPFQRAALDDEVPELDRWVRSGGRLLVVDDAGLNEEDVALSALLESANIRVQRQVTDLDPATLMLKRPERTAASGIGAGAGSRELRRVMLHQDAALILGGAFTPLLIDDDGDVLAAESPYGRGHVVVVLGPLLGNDRLLDGDGLRFALALLEALDAEDRGVAFDEYHHGHGGLLVSFEGLDRVALIWAGIQAFAAIVLYTIARGTRFGPPVMAVEPERRSHREFVDAMAFLYRRAEARSHALRTSLDRVVHELRARYEIDERPRAHELADAVARRTGRDPTSLRDAVERTERVLRSGRIGERELTATARALEVARREVLRDDRTGP